MQEKVSFAKLSPSPSWLAYPYFQLSRHPPAPPDHLPHTPARASLFSSMFQLMLTKLPVRSIVGPKLEEDLNFGQMEDNLNFCWQMEDNLIGLEIGIQPHFFGK